jgi:hypothetical protein
MQPQPQPQVATKAYLTPLAQNKIRFEFNPLSGVPIPKNELIHALAEEIHQCGSNYYSTYLITVVDMVVVAKPGITWLQHDPCQRGIGFNFGPATEGGRTFKSRRYSVRPLGDVDVSALYDALTGTPSKSVAPPPKLTLVELAQSNGSTTLGTSAQQLAAGLQKLSGYEQDIARLEAEEAELDRLLPQLEAKAAEFRNTDALVEARLRELNAQVGS